MFPCYGTLGNEKGIAVCPARAVKHRWMTRRPPKTIFQARDADRRTALTVRVHMLP